MDLEAKQRITGFFIEEARVCLQTLEQGLPVLPERAADGELIDDLCRAAHSIKGGALMLEIGSVGLTAHRMEDTLKVFRARNIPCDRDLQSLLLRCQETLTYLIEEMQSPLGLSPENASQAMAAIEPAFHQLEFQTKVLRGEISAKAAAPPARTEADSPGLTASQPQPRPLTAGAVVGSTVPSPRTNRSVDVGAPLPRLAQPKASLQSANQPELDRPTESTSSTQSRPSQQSYFRIMRRLVMAIFQYAKYLGRRMFGILRGIISK